MNPKLDSQYEKQSPHLSREKYNLEVSNVKFPNMEFHGRPELARVVQKLFWSCQALAYLSKN